MIFSTVVCTLLASLALEDISRSNKLLGMLRKTRSNYVANVDDGYIEPTPFMLWSASKTTRMVEELTNVRRPVVTVGLVFVFLMFYQLTQNDWMLDAETQFFAVVALAPILYFNLSRPNMDWFVQWNREVIVEGARGRLEEMDELVEAIESGEEEASREEYIEVLECRMRLQQALSRLED